MSLDKKDYLSDHVDEEPLKTLKQAGKIADRLEMKAFVVGGFVRDLFLQQRNYDIDIVIEGDGLLFAQEYKKEYGKRLKIFARFGTAFVILRSGKRVDISTARTEYYPSSGSLPSVTFSHIKNDLFRRDFTINSMAIQINSQQFGKLYDYYGGRKDLELGIIRVLNDFSFIEDPIRILRAIRFEQRFNFTIEPKTLDLIYNSLSLFSLETVSAERIQAELIYSCKKGPVDKFFVRLEELQILRQINRNLIFTDDNKLICKRISKLIRWYRSKFPKEKREFWILYHLALVNGLPLEIKEEYAKSLKYSAKFLNAIRKTDYFIAHTLQHFNEIEDEGSVAVLLKRLDTISILFIIAAINYKSIKDKLTRYLTAHRLIKPILNGDNIIKMGIPQGEEVGKILTELYKGRVNGLFTNKEAEKEYVLKRIETVLSD